ncbi:MAG: alanine:cation symporter family protein [Clostridium sp.]|nr:alanine:cation symporter family protein [Clostridium sp.]
MFETISKWIIAAADFLGGYPLFLLLIGGGLYLFFRSGFVSLRYLPEAIKALRQKSDAQNGQISSAQALASVVAATIGLGNIAGVAIALVVGGPGAIFWMWVSALVGMSTKYHEGVLAIIYKGKGSDGSPQGGPMYIIENGLGRKFKPLAVFFAIAGMFGTLCIMNANQLTEAFMSVFTSPEGLEASGALNSIGSLIGMTNDQVFKLLFGIVLAFIVALVVLRGIKRIARVASVLVPFMVGAYFIMVAYIIITHISDVPAVFASIFREAFYPQAGLGAIIYIAMTGARRAALVNDAGIGTGSIMHGASRNNEPVREGLVAMLGPSIDSGLVCTLTAFAILLCGNIEVEGVKGLQVAMAAFAAGIPYGEYLLILIVACFALSSMFSYSFYGTRCAAYLFGEKNAKFYTWAFILTLVVFAVIPLEAAVGLCDLFYALMAIPTMIALLALGSKVRAATKEYHSRMAEKEPEKLK